MIEPGGFFKAEHQVHILHRLSGGTFYQIVDDDKHDDSIPVPRAVNTDTAGIGAPHTSRFRVTASGHYVNEGFAAKTRFV